MPGDRGRGGEREIVAVSLSFLSRSSSLDASTHSLTSGIWSIWSIWSSE